MRTTYDLVAVGGGSAGFNAARIAVGLGKRVAVVDGARELGGLCILRGCMPSKTLIYSAEVLHLARIGERFGLRIPEASPNMLSLNRRKRRLIAEFAGDRVKALTSGKFDLIRGFAHFQDPETLILGDGTRIRSKHFLIGTGSKVSVPAIAGLADARFWTSDDVLDLNFVPKSVIVLGGGIVACELAQFLRRIGSRVCLIQRSPHLLREHSESAADVVKRAFVDEGMEVHTGTQLLGIRANESSATVRFKVGGKTLVRRAEHLLNALGREPATGALMLDRAGVKIAENGRILVNRWQQTSVAHIYAAGDCCGPHEIVHVAIQQAELAARHACGLRRLRPVDYSLLLGVVFTDPQVACLGRKEPELLQSRTPYLAASYPFNDHGKSILMEANYGYVKILADPKTGRILGAEIVGKDAGELIHCLSTAMAMRATVYDMLRAPWYHPTLAEIITYPLEEIADTIMARGAPRAHRH